MITQEPSGLAVLVGQSASFSVAATGTSPMSYQWFKDTVTLTNGGAYSGVNSNVLTVVGAGTNNAGSYSVMITNSAGATNSFIAPLQVGMLPSLTLSPGAGGLQLSANLVTGIQYVVQTATSLPPQWVSISTNVVPPSGIVSITNPVSGPKQFFRLAFP